MLLSHLSARFIIPRRYQPLVSDAKNSVKPISTVSMFSEFLSTQEIGHGWKQLVIWWRKIRAKAGCGSSSIPPNSWIFVMVIRILWGLALSCCKRTLFQLTNAGISVSKFHELVPVVENKDPHRLHACLEQTPSESHLRNSIRHTLLWGRTDFFNDDFGRLAGTEPLFWGVRVGVIDPIFIAWILLINLSSMVLPVSWWQIYTLSCANSWGTDLQLLYDFPSVLIWRCMASYNERSFSESGFSSKTLSASCINFVNLSLLFTDRVRK